MKMIERIESLGGRVSIDDGKTVAKFYHVDFSENDFEFSPIFVDLLAVYGSNLNDRLLVRLLNSIESSSYFFAYCPNITNESIDVLSELSSSKKVQLLDVGIDELKLKLIN